MDRQTQRKLHLPPLFAVLAGFVLVLAAPRVDAMTRGQTPQGWAFFDGGIGSAEIEGMEAQKGRYSLWIITAARRSGAYLADADIAIVDEKGRQVFERRLDGPWLMIDLPVGRYTVRARVGQETQSRTTTIHAGDHHQVVLRFEVEGDVLPKH